VVDCQGLVKRLNLPIGWAAPTELTNDDIRASALTRDHLHDDVRGLNASLELIRRRRGGRWPTEPVTEDFNYVDLVWHLTKTKDMSFSQKSCPRLVLSDISFEKPSRRSGNSVRMDSGDRATVRCRVWVARVRAGRGR
jgi:hypothetical protein